MITVSISVNGRPIYARTAVNKTRDPETPQDDPHEYHLDDGSVVMHIPDLGCIELAIKMLKTIKEIK